MLLPDTYVFGHEWATLQNNHEQYEKHSLLIKLGSIAVFILNVAFDLNFAIAVSLLLIMWVQEGIFRTTQSRFGERILRVEQLIHQGSVQTCLGYQLHSEWMAMRPGFTGLLAEYGKNMLRPTVAFPHVLLVVMNLGWAVLR